MTTPDAIDPLSDLAERLAVLEPGAVAYSWKALGEALTDACGFRRWNYVALLCLTSQVEDGWLRPTDPKYIDALVFNHRINDALFLTQYLRKQSNPNVGLRRLRLLARRWNFPNTDRWVSSDDVKELITALVQEGAAVVPEDRVGWTARTLAQRLSELNDRLKDGALMQMMRHAGALNGMQWRRLTKDTKAEVIHVRLHAASAVLTTTVRVGGLTRRARHLLPIVLGKGLTEQDRESLDSHYAMRTLGRKVFDLLTTIQQRQPVEAFLPELRAFYDLLLGPLFAKPGVAERIESLGDRPTLVIVTHGALAQLPFAALHDGGGYLVERFNVVQAPPLFPAEDFATGDLDWEALWGGERIPAAAAARGLFDTVGLDHAAVEARNLHRHYGPRAEVGQGHWRPETLQQLTRERGVAFLSAHVRPSNEGGGQTAVVTPAGDEVRFGDVLTEAMAADLLVLAGCVSTGQSDWLSDGETSLVSLYRRAGVQAVISTLWPVNDAATPLYTDALMGALAAGRPRAGAHGTAQLALMRSTARVEDVFDDRERLVNQPRPLPGEMEVESRLMFDHPYFWGAFALAGAWR